VLEVLTILADFVAGGRFTVFAGVHVDVVAMPCTDIVDSVKGCVVDEAAEMVLAAAMKVRRTAIL
jgi:hypothetical protein